MICTHMCKEGNSEDISNIYWLKWAMMVKLFIIMSVMPWSCMSEEAWLELLFKSKENKYRENTREHTYYNSLRSNTTTQPEKARLHQTAAQREYYTRLLENSKQKITNYLYTFTSFVPYALSQCWSINPYFCVGVGMEIIVCHFRCNCCFWCFLGFSRDSSLSLVESVPPPRFCLIMP